MPFLSVIVTVYNIEAFLPQCISSVLEQSFDDLELILVDDGSKDRSGNLCDEYAKRDKRIKVIHRENKGLVNARKTGLEASRGKYIGFVDGDDWIERDMYESMLSYARQYDCDIVMSDIDFADSRAGRKSAALDNSLLRSGYYDREALEKEIFPMMLYSGFFYKFGVYPVIWNKVFRRELLIKHQMAVDEKIKFGEDIACVYPCLFDAKSMYFMKHSCHYHYRFSGSQMTYAYDRAFLDRFRALYFFFRETDFSKAYPEQTIYYFKYALKQAVNNELRSGDAFTEKRKNLRKLLSEQWVKDFMNTPLPERTLPQYRLYYSLIKKGRFRILSAITRLYNLATMSPASISGQVHNS